MKKLPDEERKKRRLESSKRWRENNKGYGTQWYRKNKEKAALHRDRYRKNNRDDYLAAQRAGYWANREKQLERGKEYGLRTKAAAMEKYGGKCNACDADELAILTIDHINDDGKNEHMGSKFYRYLLRCELRSDLCVLCMACQWRKRIYGKDRTLWFRNDNPTSSYGLEGSDE